MFAKSLESIPKIIADNAGLDSLDVINKLRHRHGTLIIIQLKEDQRICTLVLISTMVLEIVSNHLCGSQLL